MPVATQEMFFPVYADAIAAEVRDIARTVDRDDLVIQYDVAVEFGVLTASFPAAGNLAEKQYIVEALQQALEDVPAGVERGLHLCYGDYKHRHFLAPHDLSLLVRLIKRSRRGGRRLRPHAGRSRDRPRQRLLRAAARPRVVPSASLWASSTTRATRSARSTSSRRQSAGSGGTTFEVATECGMARIDERGPGGPTLERLLTLHAEVAAPVR